MICPGLVEFSHIRFSKTLYIVSEREFARVLLKWYQHHKRSLPWRDTRDPFRIWLSEIILQQTRVAQGLAYYNDFVKAFPTVQALASASEQKILRHWEGLGYYTRARNLHQSARMITKEMNGDFPNSYAQLLKLPGVGPYTAAAIASIAFDERVAVLDGNVYRVLSRIFGIDTDISSAGARNIFFDRAMALMPTSDPGDFNQAMMEFGALQCTPRNPACSQCPFASVCVARKSESVMNFPVKLKKPKITTRYLNYFVVASRKKVALKQRTAADIWKGLYDFYLVETKKAVKPEVALRMDKALRHAGLGVPVSLASVSHQLTHQKLCISFIGLDGPKENLTKFSMVSGSMAFYSWNQAAKLPKPVPVKAFLQQMKNRSNGK